MTRRARISIRAALAGLACVAALAGAARPEDLRVVYARAQADWPASAQAMGQPPGDLAPSALLPPPDPGLAALGRAFFHDRRLSASGATSCADCHQPAHGLSEPRPSVPGVGRKTPSLHAVIHRRSWGWDGRHKTLRAALLAPLTHPAEMGNADLEALIRRVEPDYGAELTAELTAVFGDAKLSSSRLADAVAAWLQNQDLPSRLDRFLTGEGELTDQELLGLHLFRTKARCVICHHGPTLSDERFHNLGLSSFGEASQDLGRWRATQAPEDTGRFRTASLRGIAARAPYMHSGHFATLAGVVRFYARGGGEVRARGAAEAARPLFAEAARLAPELQPLDLSESEIAALVAFLQAL
ncbi:cytochrome-c peroxidase [Paracoccus aminophilus]|uniref:Cytochrome c peroxidase n=1 Tax=Paracoccus aminophilus JCM 7686 TaxID=1367847 RepID=S5YAF6_PARAH|nr:cytochrome c peroxidase [Paracoccus aminophilus]AGT08413.1 cytochrome c peroxidase [Paracoccus aminophilus JCM 7686]